MNKLISRFFALTLFGVGASVFAIEVQHDTQETTKESHEKGLPQSRVPVPANDDSRDVEKDVREHQH